jgi:hypothetical protein
VIPYHLTHVFTFIARLGAPDMIGDVGDGVRVDFPVVSGEVTGPKVTGTILAAGGDALRVSPNGVGNIDVWLVIKADDGALISVSYSGVADLGPDGFSKMLHGDPLPDGLMMYAAPRCSSGHPRYAWLNRDQFLGVGQLHPSRLEVVFDVYRVHD